MSRKRTDRAILLNDIVFTLGRELSTQTILFHAAIAERLGLNPTDHKALDLICREENMTAGRLAELTRLTTGAVTGIVDRLEKAGFVQRVRPQSDRRQVLIQLIPENVEKIHDLFESMSQAVMTLTEQYSDRDLAVIHDYLTRSIQTVQVETAKLQEVEASEL
ncbi:MarR family transcriptional regulator [Phormidium tenue FACHB-886]|nr:MarR family transcriptional regulator [Phormidium tenue FACHB-886]